MNRDALFCHHLAALIADDTRNPVRSRSGMHANQQPQL